jgi:hypothetical protein
MPNSYFNATGAPATGAGLTSAQFRNEFALIEAGFDDVVTYVHPNHTGDVTSVADGAQTIANKVTMTATSPVVVSGTPTVIATAPVAISLPAATNAAAGHATAAHIQAIEANTAKVTNATHTGDVTGATALTIAAKAVTAAKIADTTITATQIASGTITATQLASKTVTAAVIADTTITAAQITNSTITGAKIASTTVDTGNLTSAATPIGVGQNYATVGLANNTPRTNSTGRPILVIINVLAANPDGCTLYIDNKAIGTCGGVTAYFQMSGIVPPGQAYKYVSTGSTSIVSLYELST